MHSFINETKYDVRLVYSWYKKEFVFYKKPDKLSWPVIAILCLGIGADTTPTGIIARNYFWKTNTAMSGSFSYNDLLSDNQMIKIIIISSIVMGILFHLVFEKEMERKKIIKDGFDKKEVINSAFSIELKTWEVKNINDYKKYIIKIILINMIILFSGILLFQVTKHGEVDNVYDAVTTPLLIVFFISIFIWVNIEMIPKFYLTYKWIKKNSDNKGNIVFSK